MSNLKDMKIGQIVHSSDNMIYVAMDGDNIGASVERAVMTNDLAKVVDCSTTIKEGQELLRSFAAKNQGIVYVDGGDDISFMLPQDKESLLEKLRSDYKSKTGYTITVGIGKSMSEAVIAMVYGKLTGKDKLVTYTEEVKKEYTSLNTEKSEADKMKQEGLL